MIIGSGLLAQAFEPLSLKYSGICIYAAGVSNSTCSNANEFMREHERLSKALELARKHDLFCYFGTCSAMDPDSIDTPYVRHKLEMERLVSSHPRFLILRLPQVAGKTPNPHTLLNFLYARISRSESFFLWHKAKRNIIDVTDVVKIADCLFAEGSTRKTTVNIANITSYPIVDIVSAMERTIGKRAIYEVVHRGSEYKIETGTIVPLLKKASVSFHPNYLELVVNKYYGKYS